LTNCWRTPVGAAEGDAPSLLSFYRHSPVSELHRREEWGSEATVISYKLRKEVRNLFGNKLIPREIAMCYK
jgi:hypothetical protein